MKETFKNMGMNLLMEFLVSMLKIDENKPSNAFYSIESGFKQIIPNSKDSLKQVVCNDH
jgi:hypothetical protein